MSDNGNVQDVWEPPWQLLNQWLTHLLSHCLSWLFPCACWEKTYFCTSCPLVELLAPADILVCSMGQCWIRHSKGGYPVIRLSQQWFKNTELNNSAVRCWNTKFCCYLFKVCDKNLQSFKLTEAFIKVTKPSFTLRYIILTDYKCFKNTVRLLPHYIQVSYIQLIFFIELFYHS